jgi:uncharacterized protein
MAEPIPLRQRRPCPICKKTSVQKFHPFCSQRCADTDLSRWLGGKYAIPTPEEPDLEASQVEHPKDFDS